MNALTRFLMVLLLALVAGIQPVSAQEPSPQRAEEPKFTRPANWASMPPRAKAAWVHSILAGGN
jgi:hypothetical protein